MMSTLPKVLVVGSGGREHTLVWASAPSCSHIWVAPGNGGTSQTTLGSCTIESLPNISTVKEIITFCTDKRPNLVIVGPEAPLAEGLAGKFSQYL